MPWVRNDRCLRWAPIAPSPHLSERDISMPRKTRPQAARELTHRRPELRIPILSMHDNEQYLFEAKAGASGFALESAVDRGLVEACRVAMRGEPFLYPGVRSHDSVTGTAGAALPRSGPAHRHPPPTAASAR